MSREITYTSEIPKEYAAALDTVTDLTSLLTLLESWRDLAPDALSVAKTMTAADMPDFLAGLRKERRGKFAGEAFDDKYGAITLPEIMFKVSMAATHFHVPWGLAYIRLRDTGNLPKVAP